ncbi:TPA: hypothetical protein JDD40_000257 [Salmonella enterica subsp. diarizonae]|nr:hypothetical protein [Salmonella enterica subsp. diarizonae]
MFKKLLKVIIVILIVLFVIGYFSDKEDKTSSSSTTSTSSSDKVENKVKNKANDLYAGYPDKEVKFIRLVEDAKNSAKDASNDMQKGGIKSDRDDAICNLLTSKTVKGWIGIVDDIDSNSDGLGVLSIKIARDVFVQTSNNAISDIGYGTLIDPHSPVFKKASTLKKGDLVMFSGRFFASEDSGCLGEWSMTLNGKIKKPEFVFKFTDVNKYKLPDFPPEACGVVASNLKNVEPLMNNFMDAAFANVKKGGKPNPDIVSKLRKSGLDEKINSLYIDYSNLSSDDPRMDFNNLLSDIKQLISATSQYSIDGNKNAMRQASNDFQNSAIKNQQKIVEKCPSTHFPF